MTPETAELDTPRLRLVSNSPEIVRAYFQDREQLQVLLGAEVPADWPVDPVIMDILKGQMDKKGVFAWADFIYIHKADRKVIGDGGFKGPPDSGGRVEMGYAVIPDYRNQGYATEAARALMDYAFSNPGVSELDAETSVNGMKSIAVLRKLGMERWGTRRDPEEGDLYCWRITRSTKSQAPNPK